MEFLKLVRKKSFVSEFVYAILNAALAVGVLLVVRYTESVWFAIALIALSKWRVFAVRPRYWWANIRSNMVDFIVGVSFALNMNTVNTSGLVESQKLFVLLSLAALYIGWLLLVKPRSRRSYIVAQAGVAVFLGTSALFTVGYNWPVSVVALCMWLIGSVASRHILSSYDDETYELFLSLAWGVALAEIGWISYHWAIAYPLPIFTTLMIPQAAFTATLVSFLAYKCYDSFYHHAKIRMTDVLLPLLFTVSVLFVLLVVFNRVGAAI